MSNFSQFDSNRPATGANVTGEELRSQFSALASFNAGPTEPVGDAIFIGDVRFSSVSASVRYKLAININGVSQVVDIRTNAVSVSAVTPAEVVEAINDAFGDTVAYIYGTETYESASFVALIAPRAITEPYITLSNTGDGADAIDNVFGVSLRRHGMPYTVTRQAPPYGMHWLRTSTAGAESDLRVYLGTGAKVVGYKNLAAGSGTLNLSVRSKLRILLVGPTATWPASGWPLDVTITGVSSSATTPTEVATAINTAFQALPGWTGQGPASIVTRDGTGQYLQLVAGPDDAPYTGPLSRIELSNLSLGGSAGIGYLVDDALEEVFGLSRGEGDKQFSRVPYIFKGANFSDSYIRGVGDRRGAGIGAWGSSMDSAVNIPSAGAVDGEVRTAKDHGIPWVYRQANGGWRRLIPGYVYPIKYSKSTESYTLSSTSDTFTPHPLNYLGYDSAPAPIIAPDNLETGSIGDVVTLTDGKDPRWLVSNYTDGRSFSMLEVLWDNFRITGTSLNRSWHGIKWDTYDPSTTSSATRLKVSVAGYATTDAYSDGFDNGPVVALQRGAGSIREIAKTGSSPYSILIPGITVAQPIREGTLHVWVTSAGSDQATLSNSAPYSYYGFDNGAGTIGGSGITGTIDYDTGAAVITVAGLSAFDTLSFSYSQQATTEIYSVSCDVRKSGRQSYDDEPVQAGLVYCAHHTVGAYSVDTGSGFSVVIDDGGIGALYSNDGHTAVRIGDFFLLDPPLDDQWRTLRVLYTQEGSNTVHSVFWNGSNKVTDWLTKDYASPEAGLSSAATAGGTEIDRPGKLVSVQSIPAATITGLGGTHNLNITGHLSGIWAQGVAAGALAEKKVEFRNYQQHGGQVKSIFDPVPALAPVSGIRLRDSINAIRVLAGNTPIDRVITDCTAEKPLELNFLGDLVNDNLVVSEDGENSSTGRRISVGLDVRSIMATKDDRYLPTNLAVPGNPGYLSRNDLQNLNGRVAYWSLSQMIVNETAGGYVSGLPGHMFDLCPRSDALATLNAIPGASGPHRYWAYSSTGGWTKQPIGGSLSSEFIWRQTLNYLPGSYTIIRTTLPKNGANGINWKYVLTRFDVSTERSITLQNAWAGGGSGLWAASNPIRDPYMYFFAVDETNTDANYESFKVSIGWSGPVRPRSIHMDIMAIRVGT